MTKNNRILILALACGLFIMLGASLWQRFLHPSLTVKNFSEPSMREQAAMGGIGQLMEQAARNPGDRATLLRLVEQLMAIGQWQSAENFALKALALDPADKANPGTMNLLAVINHNMGKHREAAELLEKLLSQTENPSARYSLAILYLHYLHEPAAGIEQLEKGLQSPDLSPALAEAIKEELGKARAAMPPWREEAAPATEKAPEENNGSQ